VCGKIYLKKHLANFEDHVQDHFEKSDMTSFEMVNENAGTKESAVEKSGGNPTTHAGEENARSPLDLVETVAESLRKWALDID
jgi:hypothetical protein